MALNAVLCTDGAKVSSHLLSTCAFNTHSTNIPCAQFVLGENKILPEDTKQALLRSKSLSWVMKGQKEFTKLEKVIPGARTGMQKFEKF